MENKWMEIVKDEGHVELHNRMRYRIVTWRHKHAKEEKNEKNTLRFVVEQRQHSPLAEEGHLQTQTQIWWRLILLHWHIIIAHLYNLVIFERWVSYELRTSDDFRWKWRTLKWYRNTEVPS